MIEFFEESKAEFEEELGKIGVCLNRFAEYPGFHDVISRFQKFAHRALIDFSFLEEEYVDFVENVVDKLRKKIKDKDVIELLINLSRIDNISHVYSNNSINMLVASVIVESPDHFASPFNCVMISDYVYSYYYWRSKEIISEIGIDSLFDFLEVSLYKKGEKNEIILTSVLSSFMDIYFSNDKMILEKIISSFGSVESIRKKAQRLLLQL